MTNSILNTVKLHIGISEDCDDFDARLINHINTALFVAYQIGVSTNPKEIESQNETWEELFPNIERIPALKTYIGDKVQFAFDPPLSGSAMEALKNRIAEFESRINYEVDF